jgi:hypothetical protein
MSEHTLNITLGTAQRQFKVETTLDDSGDEPDWPPSIEGKFLDVAVEESVTLKFPTDKVTVTIRGKRYKFDRFEKDGTFILIRDF